VRFRCLTTALFVSTVIATAARAQTGPGAIYYHFGANSDPYRVSGDGTNNVKLWNAPPFGVAVTAFTTYPGGRQLATTTKLAGIPGTASTYGDITLLSEQRATPTTVTNFRGPQFVDGNAPRIRYSNDQQDRFLSFIVYDSRTSTYLLVRYNGPISDFFQTGFVPLTSDDPRLVVLTTTSVTYTFWDWDPTGTKLTYSYQNVSGKTLIYVYNTITNTSTLVNNPAVTGLDLSIPRCSSTEFRYFGPATYNDGTKGIVSFYPPTGQFNWVIKEGGKGTNQVSSFASTAISPDGTVLAFGMLRVVNKQTVPSLVRVPVNGGSYTPLVNFPTNTVNTIDAGGLGWKW
jgi:hypothetical protein